MKLKHETAVKKLLPLASLILREYKRQCGEYKQSKEGGTK